MTRKIATLSLHMCLVLGLQACGGCEDPVDSPDAQSSDASTDLSPDSGPEDMSPDVAPPEDMSEDTPEDMRPPRPDLAPWDFGNTDLPVVPFALEAVIPPSGPITGGTRVRIQGTSLVEGTRVLFGSQELEVELSAQGFIARTPPGAGVGPVTVKAIAPDGRVSSLPSGFTYTTELRVDEVFPNRVPTRGGTLVTLRGQGFHPQTRVSFGGVSARTLEILDARTMRAVVPARDRAGVVDVRVTTPEDVHVLDDGVTYFTPLEILEVTPASVPAAGGDAVTVRVRGADADTVIDIDGVEAPVISRDPVAGTITISAPAHAPGLVSVTARSSEDAVRLEDALFYRADDAPALASVRPTFGPDDGGVEVEVLGFGLDAPDAQIQFDTAPATIISATASRALVTLPPGTPGLVDVVLRVGGNEVARLSNAFEYRTGLEITSATPETAEVSGGVEVTLLGSDLAGVTRVTFGGVPARIISTVDDAVVVEVPAHSAGSVDIELERDGIKATLPGGFTYTEPLEIWAFTPTRGAVSGDTYIAVRGTGLTGALSVLLGGQRAQVVRRIDDNNLYFYTPPGAPGLADLVISRDDMQAEGPYSYEYFNPASRFGGASGDEVVGAVNVSVFDVGGSPIEGAFVMLSTRADTRYQGFADVNGMITLSGPDVLGAQTVTATAAGYSSALVQAVDAENVTIFLNRLDPNPGSGSGDPPPFGIIRGDVTTLGKLADPTNQRTYDMAVISTTSLGTFGGNPSPGPGSVVLGEGRYEITTRIGDMAVIALCGVYDEDLGAFSPQYLGIERFVFVADQQQYEIDLLCDIPLDKQIQVKLVNPVYNPQGPDINRATVFWDFGFEGVFPSPFAAEGLDSLLTIERQPEPTGVLSDMTFNITAGSYTGQSSPATQTGLSNISDISRIIQMPPLLDVPEPVSPLPGGVVENSEIRWESTGPYPPDMTILILRNQLGIPAWSMVVPGTQTSVRLPEFPDFSALPLEDRPVPYGDLPLYLTIRSVRIPDFDFASFTYEDLGADRWEAFSLSRWAVQFR